jgi:hypothetical protein
MELQPPAGSKIQITSDSVDPTIIVPPVNNFTRYPIGLFLLFWLGGWSMGFRSALAKIMSGETGNGFLIFWLCGWTLGGVFAAYSLYRLLRPSVPEKLELRRNSVAYDSGVAPPQLDSSRGYQNPKKAWSSAFPKRVRTEFDRGLLQSLRLRETEAGNRLTIDVGAERIEIAAAASEVEREWLARLLVRRYALPQVLGGVSAEKT